MPEDGEPSLAQPETDFKSRTEARLGPRSRSPTTRAGVCLRPRRRRPSVSRSPANTLPVFAGDGNVAVAGADEAIAGAECAQIGEDATDLAAHGEAGEAKDEERGERQVELEGLCGLDERRWVRQRRTEGNKRGEMKRQRSRPLGRIPNSIGSGRLDRHVPYIMV